MKRAALTAYATPPSSDPADLTDRLLEHKADLPARPPAKRRGEQPRARRKANAGAPEAITPQPASVVASSLETALAAADLAAEALRQAAREAPARYDVALRYRLDALAHHLQQVKEFMISVVAR